MKTFLNGFFLLVFMIPALFFAQTTVSGTVTDEANAMPLPGVNILIKGTNTGASSDFDGNFSITVSEGQVLVFSYLGYETKEITYGGEPQLNITLTQDAGQLDEVVIIGYGTTTKKDATGSIESVTEKDFTKGNIVTPENLIQGRVAGVSVTTSGAPGSGSQIRIRGGSSINASNDPLIIIDGLPISNDGIGGSRGVLSNINPNDIESFTVLKDASATAIYGSRASNGVIIIVTKKGRSTFTADYDLQYTFGENDRNIEVFSADQFRNLVNSQPVNGSTLNTDLLGDANTNWQDEIFQETVSAIHNVTLRGSLFDVLPARFSFGVTNIEGGIITDNFERRNLSVSLNPSLFDDHLKVNLNANLAFEDSRFADSGVIGSALRYDPTQPVYDPASPFGGFYQHRNGGTLLNGTTNPVASLLQAENFGDTERFFGNLNLDYKFHFLPELKAVLNLGFDQFSGFSDSDSVFATNDDVSANSSISYQIRKNQSLDGYLNYKTDIDIMAIDATAGYSYQRFTNNGFFTGNRFDPQSFGDTFEDPDVVLIGFLGRLNLTFNEKYLFTATYRRDGTSRFSEENQFGDFGGIAVAWQMSDEDFLKDSKTISNLKLRASYGLTGQQSIGVGDLYLSRFRGGNENSIYQFGNTPIRSFIPSPINEDIKWEETRTIEVGIDYGLFNNRINGSLNLYQKNSFDLVFFSPIADAGNFSNSILKNVGNFKIQGLEFSVSADVISEENFNWNVNFNASLFNREVTEIPQNQDINVGGISGGTGNTIQIIREGEAPNSFYVFKQLYDSNGAPIEGAYADLDGNNIINDNDRYIRANPDPDAILGFQSSIDYENFDFAFNLRANIGNYVYNNVNSSRAQYELLLDNSVLGNIPTSVLDTNFQRTSDVITSDIYLENASFLRMDNITLGYTFQKISNVLKSVRVWAGMQNVFVISDYSGVEPEQFNGIDNTIYPRFRNILVGTNIKF